jgi:hypothetical protein
VRLSITKRPINTSGQEQGEQGEQGEQRENQESKGKQRRSIITTELYLRSFKREGPTHPMQLNSNLLTQLLTHPNPKFLTPNPTPPNLHP